MTTSLRSLVLPIALGALAVGASRSLQEGTLDRGAPPGQAGESKDAPTAPAPEDGQARAELVAAMAKEGIRLDLDLGLVSIPATVQMRQDLLEFVLCTQRGQVHEALFLTEVSPTVLNAALLSLGVEPGENARLEDPELASGGGAQQGVGSGELSAAQASELPDLLPPEGDGFYLYVAWREGEEIYFYRVDDLIANLASGRTLRRHRWVFLGSRVVEVPVRAGQEPRPPVFAAELEGNLINVSFFFGGNTLVTAALPECVEQTIWVGNTWLLPPTSSPVEFFFAREPLETVPAPWRETLPVVKRDPAGPEGGR